MIVDGVELAEQEVALLARECAAIGARTLEPRCQRMLVDRALGATFKEAGAEEGISGERTRQVFYRAAAQLREAEVARESRQVAVPVKMQRAYF